MYHHQAYNEDDLTTQSMSYSPSPEPRQHYIYSQEHATTAALSNIHGIQRYPQSSSKGESCSGGKDWFASEKRDLEELEKELLELIKNQDQSVDLNDVEDDYQHQPTHYQDEYPMRGDRYTTVKQEIANDYTQYNQGQQQNYDQSSDQYYRDDLYRDIPHSSNHRPRHGSYDSGPPDIEQLRSSGKDDLIAYIKMLESKVQQSLTRREPPPRQYHQEATRQRMTSTIQQDKLASITR